MQDKIIAAIYKVLRREIENEDRFSFGTDLLEVATEIYTTIAPLVKEVYEAGVNSCSCGECSYCLESGVDSFESFMA